MEKILFLFPAYPYGHLGPSNNCTVRVMDALVQTGRYEVYNISYSPSSDSSKPNYKIINGVHLLQLPFPETVKDHSRTYQRIIAFLRIPIYPLTRMYYIWQYYKSCKRIVGNEHFDLLISQYNPFESVISGAMLRKKGYVCKHIVLSWDVIYGKRHHSIIPNWYALQRQRKLVNWIARNTDKLVTLYSQKDFHEEKGDVPAAIGKRIYLGIPSLTRHKIVFQPTSRDYIKTGKINIIYAGHIFNEETVAYSINLFNASSFAKNINFILLCKDPDKDSLKKICEGFKGTIQLSQWVPLEELYYLYSKVDIFVAYGGKWILGIPGKTYDYMSFGKPILHFYRIENDANLSLFAPYPLFKGLNVNLPIDTNKTELDSFIEKKAGQRVEFEEVERLFPYATMSAYIRVIDDMVGQDE